MATTSETGQVVNGIETVNPPVSVEKSGKAETAVKQLNTGTGDAMKTSMETTQNENGESEEQKNVISKDHEHAETATSETPTSVAGEKPVVAVVSKSDEAVVDVAKPIAAPVVTKSPPPSIEPMDAEPAPPPASVATEESVAAKPEDATDMAKVEEEHFVENKPEEHAPVETEKPGEDATAAAEEAEATSEPATTVKGGAKRGRKPGSKKAAATPKKTPATAAITTESAADEGESKQVDLAASADITSPKRTTPRRKRELMSPEAAAASGDKTPLLEAPLIVEGKRTRQRVERLDSTVLTPDKRPTEVPEGKGTKLSDIPYVDAMISKSSITDLKLLHRLVFGRAGTAHELKKHVRLFNGFDFEANSPEYEKKKKSLETAVLSDLKTTCGILGLEKSGKKEELIDVILKFVLEPADMGKKAPQSTSRRSSSTTRKSTGKRRTPGRGKKDEHSGDDEEDHEEEYEDEDAEHDEKEEPAPKRGRKSKAAAATPETAPSASKRGAVTKKSSFPSDADIKATIKDLLKDVNLEQVTMKEMTAKVYDHYPNIDLTNKKEFIKDTVKALLSSSE